MEETPCFLFHWHGSGSNVSGFFGRQRNHWTMFWDGRRAQTRTSRSSTLLGSCCSSQGRHFYWWLTSASWGQTQRIKRTTADPQGGKERNGSRRKNEAEVCVWGEEWAFKTRADKAMTVWRTVGAPSKRSSLRQPPSPALPTPFPLHSCGRRAAAPFKVWIRRMTSPLLPLPPSPPSIEVRTLTRSSKQRHPAAYLGSLTDRAPGGFVARGFEGVGGVGVSL